MKDLRIIFNQFDTDSEFVSAKKHGNGFINNTYLIRAKKGNEEIGFIMQKINSNVFNNISGLMRNIELVSDYILNIDKNIAFSKYAKSYNGNSYFCEARTDNCWRLYDYIEGSFTYEKIDDPNQFYATGKAFGEFQKYLKDFDAKLLVETIHNFHDTPHRYKYFLRAVNNDIAERSNLAKKEIEILKKHSAFADTITKLLKEETIPLRVAHNDTKLNNVLFCNKTKKPLHVIDLDTLMPGTLLYDFGDAVRYGASTAAEDERDLSKIDIDLNLFKLFTKGFLEETITFITKEEVDNLAISVLVITYELTLRFLTDYLNGDVYFKTKYKHHNLSRTRAQLKLLEQQYKKLDQMKKIVDEVYNDLTKK